MPREATARQPLCADIDGFSLHAAVRGQVELQLKTPWRDGTTHLVMSPLEFIQRVAALVPRPRLHLIRLHGVLAPNAKLRALGLRHRHAPLSELRRRGAPYHRRHPPAPGDLEDPCAPGLSADASPSLRTDLRLTKGPSSARARPARLDPQPPPKGRAREVGQAWAH